MMATGLMATMVMVMTRMVVIPVMMTMLLPGMVMMG